MRIRRLSMAEGAGAAEGTAVIIDVFRAFTCEPLMLHCGARCILLERDPAAALAFRSRIEPDAVLVGEVDEVPIPGFDLTNSPWLILRRGCSGARSDWRSFPAPRTCSRNRARSIW